MFRNKVTVILAPILLAFIVGAVLILLVKKDPIQVYRLMLTGSFTSFSSLLSTLHISTPLIISSLAFAVAFKAGFFNMGLEAQIYAGGFAAAYIGFTFPMPPGLHILAALVASLLIGSLLGLMIGFLRGKYNINEIVITLMLNIIITLYINHLTNNVFYSGEGFASTKKVFSSAILPRFSPALQLNFSFFIALAAFVFVWFLMRKSSFGIKIRALGSNRAFTEAAGLNSVWTTALIFTISGGIGALAGAGEILGTHQRFVSGFSPGYGWDGMTIALLAKGNPVGILFAALFLAIIKNGSSSIELFVGVPRSLAVVLQSLIILFLALDYASPHVQKYFTSLQKKGRNQ